MPRKSHYGEHKHKVLLLVEVSRTAHGRSPSVRELAEKAGVGVATMHLYLKRLAGEGLIEWHSNSHRSLRCTPAGSQTLSSLGLL